MSIFSGQKATSTAEPGAIEAIRARVKSRLDHGNLSRTATDLQIALPQLDSFARGTGQLSEVALHALCKELYANARFDPETDRLIDTSPSAQVIRAIANPHDPAKDPHLVEFEPGPMVRSTPLLPGKGTQTPAPTRRPGFA